MNKLPNWFNRVEEEMTVPQVAEIPRSALLIPPPNFNGDKDHEVIIDAANASEKAKALLTQYKKERGDLQVMLTEATLGLESKNRVINAQTLEITELKNTIQVQAAQVEDLRQQVADYRAFEAEHLATLKHLVARHEDFEIPLAIRKRAKNV